MPECSREEEWRSSGSLCERGTQRAGVAETQTPHGE